MTRAKNDLQIPYDPDLPDDFKGDSSVSAKCVMKCLCMPNCAESLFAQPFRCAPPEAPQGQMQEEQRRYPCCNQTEKLVEDCVRRSECCMLLEGDEVCQELMGESSTFQLPEEEESLLSLLYQEEMFVPFPLQFQRNQAGFACITKALPIPSSKSEIQQISDKWLLHSVLMLVQSWIEPLVYLQTTLDRYDGAPDMLLNKTKWVSEKLISLEQGVVVLIKKMLDEGMMTTIFSEQGIFQYDVQPEMLESVMRDYTLLSCFKKDAHKMETFLKLLKCRQTDKYNCA
ncbi:hypothetical protein L3Q82_018961 [Scortum barcoo]|uniref:Uncharacterized protein n=1 Tax=Scortum barcoo TaxID=214431 RepID=A0ACB8VFJ9_9TELE|nr:hypothetical protein L3Q82_018961 [Scortum barcoo]